MSRASGRPMGRGRFTSKNAKRIYWSISILKFKHFLCMFSEATLKQTNFPKNAQACWTLFKIGCSGPFFRYRVDRLCMYKRKWPLRACLHGDFHPHPDLLYPVSAGLIGVTYTCFIIVHENFNHLLACQVSSILNNCVAPANCVAHAL